MNNLIKDPRLFYPNKHMFIHVYRLTQQYRHTHNKGEAGSKTDAYLSLLSRNTVGYEELSDHFMHAYFYHYFHCNFPY